MIPHSRNNYSNFEHPFKTFSSLLILMSQIQIPHSKSRIPKPHFCWLPHTNEAGEANFPFPTHGQESHSLWMSPSCFFPFQDRETPLHIAVRTKNTEMVNLLLDHGASPDAIDKVYKSVFLVCRKLACKAGVFCFYIDLDFRLTVSWGESKKDSKGVVDAFPPCLTLFHVLLGRANKTKKHACSAG